MISKEETEQLKKQIIDQINSTFPEDKKQNAISQINSMNQEQFEEFLKQNNLIQEKDSQKPQKCIFCSIILGEIPFYKIRENKETIAILEINPISQGHTILIPKTHSTEIPESTNILAKEISQEIKSTLNPKSIEITSSELFEHKILNIIPIYKSETINSPRYKAKTEELKEIQKILEKKQEPKNKEKKIKVFDSKKIWLPKRIP